MFYRWWQIDDEGRRRVWRLYGWFSGLMLCGSCFGVVTWVSRMIDRVIIFRGNELVSTSNNPTAIAEGLSLWASSRHWIAVFYVSYAIDFLFLSVTRLLVLDRMLDFAAAGSMTKFRVVGGRIVVAAVLLGNATGLAASIAAAVQYKQAADTFYTASMFYSVNNTQDGREQWNTAQAQNELAFSIASTQSFCEAIVLLIIVFMFVVVGVMCTRRINTGLLAANSQGNAASATAAADSRTLRLQIVGTTGVVFVASLLRSVVSTMLAVVGLLQESGKSWITCPTGRNLCNPSCYNVFSHIHTWQNYTPQFLATVVLISSPLALLVALWGMTSKLTLQLMKSNRQQTPALSLQTPRFRV